MHRLGLFQTEHLVSAKLWFTLHLVYPSITRLVVAVATAWMFCEPKRWRPWHFCKAYCKSRMCLHWFECFTVPNVFFFRGCCKPPLYHVSYNVLDYLSFLLGKTSLLLHQKLFCKTVKLQKNFAMSYHETLSLEAWGEMCSRGKLVPLVCAFKKFLRLWSLYIKIIYSSKTDFSIQICTIDFEIVLSRKYFHINRNIILINIKKNPLK